MPLETISTCPLCNGNEFIPFLTCEDHTTTNEKFQLQKCCTCAFVVTSPRPDQRSLGRYYESDKYISHSGGTSGILDYVYLLVRKITLKRKLALISKYTATGQILDYGCGTGEFLKTCSEHGWKSFGIEPSDIAHSKATIAKNVQVFKTLSDLPASNFQVITLWHVLEHVADFENKLKQLRELLQNSGTLFVAVPNHESWDAEYYRAHWAGYDVPRHLWHFTKKDITRIAEKTELKIVDILPMKFDAYYVSLLSEKYLSNRQTIKGMISAIRNGLKSNLYAGKDNFSSLIYVLKK